MQFCFLDYKKHKIPSMYFDERNQYVYFSIYVYIYEYFQYICIHTSAHAHIHTHTYVAENGRKF